MKIFIAGTTGLLGRSLIPLLIQKGYIVRGLVRTAEKARALELAGVEAVRGDLLARETVEQLPELIRGCNAVVHIATAIPRADSLEAKQAWETTGRLRTEGTQALLQASLATGVQRYIQQSITMAYPDSADAWLDETTPLDAARTYINKMEDLIRSLSPDQLQWCILRGGSFVGPETAQEQQIQQLRAGQLVVPGDGQNYISPVHVCDMAQAISLALECAPAGSTFNIVDEPLRNGAYLDQLADQLEVARPARQTDKPNPPSQRCSNKAAREVLGWTTRHSIWPSARELWEC
jgi:nucleoside-diphosphate-sugar epimerase